MTAHGQDLTAADTQESSGEHSEGVKDVVLGNRVPDRLERKGGGKKVKQTQDNLDYSDQVQQDLQVSHRYLLLDSG
jgi:hypothetical protein